MNCMEIMKENEAVSVRCMARPWKLGHVILVVASKYFKKS
jgi:hypothetical protein